MAEVATTTAPRPNGNVEVIVHVDETLDERQRQALVDFLEATDGIESAEFCPLRFHLILVLYNRQQMSSRDVLERVMSKQLNAELIGPI